MYTIICQDEEKFFQVSNQLEPVQKNELQKLILQLRMSGEITGSTPFRPTQYLPFDPESEDSIFNPVSGISCHGFHLIFLTRPKQFQIKILSLTINQLSLIDSLNESLDRPSFFLENCSNPRKDLFKQEMSSFLQWERPDDLIQAVILIGSGHENSAALGQTKLLREYRDPKRQAQFLSATLESLNLITRHRQSRGFRYILTGTGKKIATSQDLRFQRQLIHECLQSHSHVKFWLQSIRNKQPCDPALIHAKYEKDLPAIFSGATGLRRAESLYYILKWMADRELIPLISTQDLENGSAIQLHLDLASAIREK